MTATPEQIAMARRIAADIARSQGRMTRAKAFEKGAWDNHASVRSALAAMTGEAGDG